MRQPAAVISAHDESETIGRLVARLRWHGLRVIVADSSSDDTPLRAALAGASVVYMPPDAGIGRSLMAGMRLALDQDATRIVVIDAGGSHDPNEVHNVMDAADLVIGSRYLPASRYVGNRRRREMSRCMAAACSVLARRRIHDWTSGYRGYSPALAEYLLRQPYRCRMHGWQIEVLGKTLRGGFSVTEQPITYRAGRSSFNGAVAREAVGACLRLAT